MIKKGGLRIAFKRIEDLLESNGFDYCFDLTQENDHAVLVLTPEGDSDVAKHIDELVSAFPGIPGWVVHGRRQRKLLPDAMALVLRIYGIDIGDATFDVRRGERGIEVAMHCAAAVSLPSDVSKGMLATFLDHAIGEATVMNSITRFAVLGGGGTLSSTELVDELDRHSREV
ncbi:MAG: hypothetical protein FD180_4933 [Planctomycetota bacterium]|nr:MAG: hypothetical protein FD180_4933 [Planctomycetota bacterium]